VFLKVFPRVLEIVLRLGRDHTSDTTGTVRASCVSDTPSPRLVVLNYEHEHDSDSETGKPTMGHLLHRP
jgi:hypothetical protein